VSVPEVKEFLGLIINMGLILLPNLKDYWSSERKTQFFDDVLSRDLQIIWLMHLGKLYYRRNQSGHKKNKEGTWGDRTYRETVPEKRAR
jgi:hypothetical protein